MIGKLSSRSTLTFLVILLSLVSTLYCNPAYSGLGSLGREIKMATHRNVIFFQIGKIPNNNTALDHALLDLSQVENIADRISKIDEDVSVVLDRIEIDEIAGIYKGSISRVQDTGFPPQLDGDIKKLGIKGDLLHGVCFYYRKETNILAIESDQKTISPNRFFEYLHTRYPDFSGTLKVVLDSDKIVNLDNETPKIINMAIADPTQAIGLEGESGEFLDSLASACEQFDGKKIMVSITAGRSPKKHLSNVVPMVKDIISKAAAGNLNLKKLTAKTAEAKQSNQDFPYDLLGQILRHKERIALPKDDPQALYDNSIKLVERGYIKYKAYLERYQ